MPNPTLARDLQIHVEPAAPRAPTHDWAVTDALTGSIMNSFRVLERLVREESETVSRVAGVSLAQAFVLHLLRREGCEGGWTIDELAHGTLTHPSSVTAVVRELERLGLAVCGYDAAGHERVVATTEGRRRAAGLEQLVQPRLFDALRALSPDRLVRLDVGLRAWLEQLGCWNDHPAMFGETAPDHPSEA